MLFLHQLRDAKELFEIVAHEKKLVPIIVKKDCMLRYLNKNLPFILVSK